MDTGFQNICVKKESQSIELNIGNVIGSPTYISMEKTIF